MSVVDDWGRLLWRSASVLLSYVSTLSSLIGGSAYLMADRIGNERAFWLTVVCAFVSATTTALIPLARVVHQPKLARRGHAG
jgi:hypothetical protein